MLLYVNLRYVKRMKMLLVLVNIFIYVITRKTHFQGKKFASLVRAEMEGHVLSLATIDTCVMTYILVIAKVVGLENIVNKRKEVV